jgi:hypothetical protein
VSEIKTGGIRMIPIVGGYQVWTKRFGSGSIPLLTLIEVEAVAVKP